jgi:hypothetical protein
LLFVTAPIVIRYASFSHVDFFMVFCFLLSLLLIKKKLSLSMIVLSGIIFGGVLATKMWTLVYFPAVIVYIFVINKSVKTSELIKILCVFTIASLAVPLIWYVRNMYITGNPIYPILGHPEYLETGSNTTSSPSSFIGFNWRMFLPENLLVYSPLFFMSVGLAFIQYKKVISKLRTTPFVLFFIILFVLQLTISIYLGRHLLALYSIAVVFFSAGLYYSYDKTKIIKYIVIIGYFMLFFYYFMNTLFILPYGFGWSDRNNYLTRVLGRDNSNYYDFNHLFAKHIIKNDLVATYGIVSYYYADFAYIDVNFIFDKQHRSFDLLKRNHVTKLLLKGGDIKWFCQILALNKCDPSMVKLLATYPKDTKKYNLYLLK